MLDPASQVAWSHGATTVCLCICCFCIHAKPLHRHPILIVQTRSASGSFSLRHVFILFFRNEDTRSWMRRGEENKTRRKIPALNCAPLTGPHIVAGQWTCGQSARVRYCTTGLGALHSAQWLLPVRDRASRAQQQAAPVHTSTQTFPSRGRRWWETERLFQAVPGCSRLSQTSPSAFACQVCACEKQVNENKMR